MLILANRCYDMISCLTLHLRSDNHWHLHEACCVWSRRPASQCLCRLRWCEPSAPAQPGGPGIARFYHLTSKAETPTAPPYSTSTSAAGSPTRPSRISEMCTKPVTYKERTWIESWEKSKKTNFCKLKDKRASDERAQTPKPMHHFDCFLKKPGETPTPSLCFWVLRKIHLSKGKTFGPSVHGNHSMLWKLYWCQKNQALSLITRVDQVNSSVAPPWTPRRVQRGLPAQETTHLERHPKVESHPRRAKKQHTNFLQFKLPHKSG